MVTYNGSDLRQALETILGVRGSGRCACPWCGLQGLSPLELWYHQPLWHIHEDDLQGTCPICSGRTSRLTRHISLTHGPQPLVDHRTGVFALAVVRRPSDGKFLLVQERYGEGYWLPGGGVDPGESLRQAAVREAREEAGAHIRVTGILTIESFHGGSWRRIIFTAVPAAAPDPAAAATTPADGPAPAADGSPDPAATDASAPLLAAADEARCKSLPDVESAGACWARAEQLASLRLRSASEPLTWIPWVAAGKRVLPCDRAAVPQLDAVFPDFEL